MTGILRAMSFHGLIQRVAASSKTGEAGRHLEPHDTRGLLSHLGVYCTSSTLTKPQLFFLYLILTVEPKS